MFSRLRRQLHDFLRTRSGTRFRAYHARMHLRPHLLRTLLVVSIGLTLIALGIVLLVLPGPGLLIGALGALLIAGESMVIARLLDRADLIATRRWRRWRKRD
jgi:hypothetical protein